MGELLEVLTLLLPPAGPADAGHVGDGVITADVIAAVEALVQHAIEAVGLVGVAVDQNEAAGLRVLLERIEDQLPALETQLGECSSQISEFEQAVTGLVAKRNEMEDELFDFQEQKAKAVSASGNDASAATSSATGESAVHKAEKAERRFSRVLQDSTGVRRSSLQTSAAEASGLLELAQMNRQARIKARLKELEGSES